MNYQKEAGRLSIKDAKLNFIIDVATKLFLSRGIASVTIKDIANEVGLGEATIYRYFSKKQNIVIASAMKLEKEVFEEFFLSLNGNDGFEKIRNFYYSFLDIFTNHSEFYKFISEFDSIINIEDGNLSEYESAIGNFYKIFTLAYSEGLKDGSVKEVENIEMFYLTTTHALMGLSKKLALDGKILNQDNKFAQIDELKCLIEVILFRLKTL